MEEKNIGDVKTREEVKAQENALPFYKNWRFWVYCFLIVCLGFIGISSLVNGCTIQKINSQEESETSLVDLKTPHSEYISSFSGVVYVPYNDGQVYHASIFRYTDFSGSSYSTTLKTSEVGSEAVRWWSYQGVDNFNLNMRFITASSSYAVYLAFDTDFTITCYDSNGNEVSYTLQDNNCTIHCAATIARVEFVTTYKGFYDLYYNAKINYNQGYNAGYTTGSSSGYYSGYSSGYDDGESDGYQDGYSSGYSSGYVNGYSSGYSSGLDSALEYSTEYFMQGYELRGVVLPVGWSSESLYSAIYFGGGNGATVNLVTFSDGSRITNTKSSVGTVIGFTVAYTYYDTSVSDYFSTTLIEVTRSGSAGSYVYSSSVLNIDDNWCTMSYLRGLSSSYHEDSGQPFIIYSDDTYLGYLLPLYYQSYTAGYENGYDVGYSSGYDVGWGASKTYWQSLVNPNSLTETLVTVFQQPFNQIWRFLNFNILGLNILALGCGLVTTFLVIKVIKKLL